MPITHYIWRTTIVSALECFELESFILAPSPPIATIPAPPSDDETTAAGASCPNPDYITWKKKDRFVLLWLKSTLTERALASVARSTSANQAWLTLERTFQAQTRAQRLQLTTKLQTITKGASSMIDYLDQKRQIADSLAENLTPVSDDDLITYILNGLDSSYSAFTSAFIMHSESSSVDDLIGLLLQEEACQEADLACQAATPLPTATTVPQSSFPVANQVSRTQQSPRPFSYSGSSSNSHPNENRRRRLHCQLCNKPGHEAINCWQRGNQTDYPSRRPNPRDTQRQAHLTTGSSPYAIIDPNWYFDTGATDHVTPDLNKLHLQESYTGADKLQVRNGTNFQISHSGSSSLSSLRLPKVLVVPHLTKNVLSVSQLTRDNNVYMEFWPHYCTVKTFQGKPLIHRHVDQGLYRLTLPSNKASSTLALSGVRTSLTGWHNRLAHPHESILRRLVSTFKLPISENKLPEVCQSCQLGKSHKLPFSSSHVSCNRPFDLMYSDVWGPSPLFSINGSRYFILFIDDSTKFVWIYFLSTKSQVLQTVINFRTMIKTQFDCDIKTFQSDWGGEYRNVSAYLNSCGIHHRLSCPHTSEQNGAVERRHRIIVEKGLSLLAQSALPHAYWEHAFKSATYLHNRTIHFL